jgi:hypothetical protein
MYHIYWLATPMMTSMHHLEDGVYMDLREHDYPTIPLLMKSYMDMEKVPVIPHMIEELPD